LIVFIYPNNLMIFPAACFRLFDLSLLNLRAPMTHTHTHPRTTLLRSNLVHKHTAPENSLAVQAVSSSCGASARRGVPTRLAPLVGIVHGAAGLGGVLGVVPAAQLRDPGAAAAYLGAFCVASTLSMGGFATCCAAVADWLVGDGDRGVQRRASQVEGGAAFLSAAVGLAWLGLLATGRLTPAFPL